jgi:hypothetical protein
MLLAHGGQGVIPEFTCPFLNVSKSLRFERSDGRVDFGLVRAEEGLEVIDV